MAEWMSYHRTVTRGPFGSDMVDSISENNRRIEMIESAENKFTEEIELIEGSD